MLNNSNSPLRSGLGTTITMPFRADAPNFTPSRSAPSVTFPDFTPTPTRAPLTSLLDQVTPRQQQLSLPAMSTMSSQTPVKQQSPWNSEQIKASFNKMDSTKSSAGDTARRQLFSEVKNNNKTVAWSDSYDIFYHGNPARSDSPMMPLPQAMDRLNLGDNSHSQHSHIRNPSAWSTAGSDKSGGVPLRWNDGYDHTTSRNDSLGAPGRQLDYQTITTDMAASNNTAWQPSSLDISPIHPPISGLAMSEEEYKKQLVAFIKAGGLESSNNKSPPRKQDDLPPLRVHSSASSDSGIGLGGKTADLHNYDARKHSDVTMLYLRSIGTPTYLDLADGLPFLDKTQYEKPQVHGVIKFTNIAYNVIKPEVVAALGEKARIVAMPRNSGTYAIHIMFDRNSAKSGDCFVELETESDALAFMARVRSNGNKRKIADRLVDVQLSSQTELMQAMFPKAKCVTWKGQVPVIGRPEYEFSAGFQGFLSSEEMTMTVKFASEPRKSRYSGKHIQRPYESMISCLFKYPFHATTTYTLGERDLLFSTTLKMLVALAEQIRRGISDVLTVTLLDELLHAALEVPAFSEWQRAQLVDAVRGMTTKGAEVDATPANWPFEVISRKPHASEEHMTYYASHLRDATTPKTLAERSAALGNTSTRMSCFGHINVPWPENKAQLTFAEAAKIEWDYLEMLLRRVSYNGEEGAYNG